MYKLHTECRACGYGRKPHPLGMKFAPTNEKLVEVFDLGVQPLANDFCKEGDEYRGYAPLKVLFCPRCTLAQLSVVVDPAILYKKYAYVTSPSGTMWRHFQQIHRDIRREAPEANNILEIGSNDGAFLAHFQSRGYRGLGVDPAANLNAVANRRGVETLTGLFSEGIAGVVLPIMEPDIILARHVFCHVDDWRGFVAGLESLAKRTTLICIEVPHCQNTLDKTEFDTIYHEHLSYLTLRSVQVLLEHSSLQLCRVISYPIHGGAIMLMIRSRDSGVAPDHSLEAEIKKEHCQLADWEAFSRRAAALQGQLSDLVRKLVKEGKTVAALGASAKSTVWINACGFTSREIRFIADSTDQKQYATSPGSDIPIVDEGAILRELPDYTVCFAWNFIEEILEKNKRYRDKGGKFIVPVPKVEVVNP